VRDLCAKLTCLPVRPEPFTVSGYGHTDRERGDQLVGSGHPVVIGRVERGSAIIDFDDLRVRLAQLATYRATYLTGDEKGESQVFLDRLFQAFGHQGYAEAGAKLEMRIKSASTGGTSFADLVWKPRVLIEMKKAGTDLSRHYRQAFDYWVRAVPDRPRYMMLCNFDEFWVYDFDHQLDEPVSRVTLAELPERWEPFGFMLPEERTPEFTNDLVAVTRDSAVQLARLFNTLIGRNLDRDVAQRFVLQAVMAMFSEDIRLLPTRMFTAAVAESRAGGSSYDLLFGLFEAMNTPGVTAGGRFKGTPYFNGGLYATVTPFELEPEELAELDDACRTDWSLVRPEIFGTLFEQSLGRDERHAYGAHFTSPADIAKIVGPSMTEPWRQRITAARTLSELRQLHIEMSQLRVLDPACGCGNFLYVAYRELRRLERDLLERIEDRSRAGGGGLIELPLVSPEQFHGIDIRPFAVEIAKVTLMVAKKLATDELGDSQQILPLENLSGNFTADDALRVPWPTAQLIIGNPPYLGRRKLIDERGADYAAWLAREYPHVSGVADYVAYWFPLTHDRLTPGGRAGLVATNSIRQGDTRKASLDYVVDHGGTLVEAVSSQPWDGDAVVHVSIVNWVKGDAPGPRVLWVADGGTRLELPRLTTALNINVDLRAARALAANRTPKVCHQGQTPGVTVGFEIDTATAARLRGAEPGSAAVIHPFLGGRQLLHEHEVSRSIIDIPTDDADTAWREFPAVMAHLEKTVLPVRRAAAQKEAEQNALRRAASPGARIDLSRTNFLDTWWLHWRRRADLIHQLGRLDRYIAVPRTSSEERLTIFTFVDAIVHPSDGVVAFTLDDDYSFGILQSAAHQKWFRARCTTLKADPTYTSGTVFDSFPWPQAPTPAAVVGVSSAARALVDHRNSSTADGTSLAQLYDVLRRPGKSVLRRLHDELDAAVVTAYEFDDRVDLLAQLLTLNLKVGAAEKAGETVMSPGPSRGLHTA